MVYHGRIKNGQIILDDTVRLPEGAQVRVDIVRNGETPSASDSDPSWAEVFHDLIGKAQGLPPDLARNHDHYLHGAPRR